MKKESQLVTPSIAMSYLDRNSNIRSLVKSKAYEWAKIMKEGTWISEHPDPIVFDICGKLRNGQHRLWAVKISGCPVILQVWHNVPEEIIASMDRGRSRRTADNIKLMGGNNRNRLAVAIAEAIGRSTFSVMHRAKLTDNELKQLFAEWQTEIETITEKATPFLKKGFARVPILVALTEYLKKNPERAPLFIDSYLSMDGDVSHARVLRNVVFTSKILTKEVQYGYTVTACRYHECNLEMKTINKVHAWDTKLLAERTKNENQTPPKTNT